MKIRKSNLLVALAFLLQASGADRALAQFTPMATAPPGTVQAQGGVAYQGRLENAGVPVNGTQNMIFRLFDVSTGGTPLWESGSPPGTAFSVTFTGGFFGVALDMPTSALAGAGAKYLEIEIEGVILAPRDTLSAVPYAKVAESIEGTIEISSGGFSVSNAGGTILYISSVTGQVGIGTSTPVDGARLQIIGGDVVIGTPTVSAFSASEDLFVEGNVEVNGAVSFQGASFVDLGISTDVITGQIFKVGAGTFTVLDTGRIGIGSTDPQARLEVVAGAADVPGIFLDHPTAPELRLKVNSVDRFRIQHDGTDGYFGTMAGGGDLFLQTNGTTKVIIESGGDVGIGIAPTVPLDVLGNANISGSLTLGTQLAVLEGGTGGTTPLTARNGLSALARDGTDVAAGFPTFAISISSFAAEAGRFSFNPSNCTAAGDFAKGVDQFGQAECANVGANSEGVVEGLIYDADNDLTTLLSSWTVASSGIYDIEFDEADDTFFIDVSENRIGIGTTLPTQALDVAGTVNAAAFREVGSSTLTVSIANTAGFAGAFVADPANCAAGSVPEGVTASGAAENCFDVATQAELDAHTALNNAHNATSANTIDRIVLRNGTGGFSAGTITASLNGNANTANTLTGVLTQCSGGTPLAVGIQADGDANCIADDDRPDSDAEVPDDITIDQTTSGTFRLDQTLGSTTEGQMAWDAASNEIQVGDGAGGVVTFVAGGDTSADTECAGSTTYLDGDGGCDDISNVYVNETGDEISGTLSFSGGGIDINASDGDLSLDAPGNSICLGAASCDGAFVVVSGDMSADTILIADTGNAGGNVPHQCRRVVLNMVGDITDTADCTSPNEFVMGGGAYCEPGTAVIEESYPSSNTQWRGTCSAAHANNTVYAVCCDY